MDSLDGDDRVFARMIPRKANRWIFATVGAEFVTNVMRAGVSAMEDITTVFSQRFNYEDERNGFMSSVGRDIEALDGGFEVIGASDEEWEDEEE